MTPHRHHDTIDSNHATGPIWLLPAVSLGAILWIVLGYGIISWL